MFKEWGILDGKNRDENLPGLPYLSKGKMLPFNIGLISSSGCGCPACGLPVVLWAGWSWGESWAAASGVSPECLCCGMNSPVTSWGIELPRWHVLPAARSANEQILLQLNEVFQRVVKAAFWEEKMSWAVVYARRKCKWYMSACSACCPHLAPVCGSGGI